MFQRSAEPVYAEVAPALGNQPAQLGKPSLTAEVHPQDGCLAHREVSSQLYQRFKLDTPAQEHGPWPGGASSHSRRATIAQSAAAGESAIVASSLPLQVFDQLQVIILGEQTFSFLTESLTVAATLEVSIASVKEATRTLAWLESSHSDWWQSAITDGEVHHDVRMTTLAREGSRAVAHARLAVSSYDTFLSSTRGLSPASGLDVDVLLLYLHDVTSTAKHKMETRGKAFKGSAANARLKGLKSAVALFEAPYDMEKLQSRFTASAVSRPEAPGIEVTSKHISAEAVAALEISRWVNCTKPFGDTRPHPNSSLSFIALINFSARPSKSRGRAEVLDNSKNKNSHPPT